MRYANATKVAYFDFCISKPCNAVCSRNSIQRFEVFNAETKSWDVWFEGLYVRQ